MASLCFSITQRRGESEPWAQDLASPLAPTTGWCVLGGTAPQQPHRLIHPTVRRAFGRTRDMLTGKAKVPMENRLEGRGSLSINSAGWQRQQEYQAGMVLVPEPNFLLKCNPSNCQDISADGNSAPPKLHRLLTQVTNDLWLDLESEESTHIPRNVSNRKFAKRRFGFRINFRTG